MLKTAALTFNSQKQSCSPCPSFFPPHHQVGPFIVGALIRLTSESYTTAFELFGLHHMLKHARAQVQLGLTNTHPLPTAGLSIFSGILLYLCPPFDPRKWKSDKKKQDDAAGDADDSPLLGDTQSGTSPDPAVVAQEHAIAEQTRLLGRTRYWLLISSATMYLLLYITLEATFGSYISAYAYKSGMGSLESSSYISSGLSLHCPFPFLDVHLTTALFCLTQCFGAASVWDEASRSSSPPSSRHAQCASLA